jgi:hypothetical protein
LGPKKILKKVKKRLDIICRPDKTTVNFAKLPRRYEQMNINNNAAKNVNLRPLRLLSFLGITMGVLMLMAMAAPSAHAFLLTYYDFEDGNFSSDAPGLQATTISFTASSYPGGNLTVEGTVATPVGTNLNAVTPSTIMALDAMGNTNGTAGDQYCFTLGGLTTTGKTDVTLSFAILSQGNGGQFTDLNLLYSTTGVGGAYTLFATDATLQTYATYTVLSFNASALTAGAVDGISGSNLFFEFCFSGSTNNANGNDTFIDNIQVTAVPEPSTYIGGLLGIVGLCWYQRRWFARLLGLRPA